MNQKNINKQKIEKIAKKYNLSLIILYGSQTIGRIRKESDIDVAILGKKPTSFKSLVDLNNEFAALFNVKEIDVKSLRGANHLLLYQIMRDGVLLYGDEHQFNILKLYAIRSFQETKKLRNLRDLILKKRMEHLKTIYAGQRTH